MMKAQYLLDTNICVFLFRGKYDINKKISQVGWNNCCISEVTVAELKYGVECCSNPLANETILKAFLEKITIIPFATAIDRYAEEKAKLRKAGKLVDDFDLFIACTASANNLVMVTDNEKHFDRISKLTVINWIER
ncbi:type II toxin-antitoxin system VapC family toxin [Parabacteroides faecis]|uniref:tRNA(fMet)-specific endonuclease VapC n=2 Tax=Parabacteroides faecis TaxID=1217282 RepID=A0ABR6KR03_9BACT|nr:type II toxin-antitoxin system VapC family toxin [Parabacteroides faecis]MBB4623941.1 tRNA(fMet)-specific endonuclease VapC [Parabacteroides faecis]GGK07599.1 ribonuclease VapC [Parabacteroides faecis]